MSLIDDINIALQSNYPIRKLTGPHKNLYQRIFSDTDFLLPSAKIKERIFCIRYSITIPVLCKSCDNIVDFLGPKTGYREFCSAKCSTNYEDTKNKRIATNLLKYGTIAPAQNTSIRKKMEDTCEKNHGVRFSQQNITVQAKTKNTNLTKYGSESFTTTQRFYTLSTESTHTKYGVSHVNQSHIHPDNLKKLTDKDWLYEQNTTNGKLLIEIADELGVSISTICRYFYTLQVPISYHKPPFSRMELQVQQMLSDNNVDFTVNDRTVISPKELDIVIPSSKLAIELCGTYWHSDIHPRITPTYHLDKLLKVEKLGYRLLTIFEDEWRHNPEIVTSKILHILGKTSTKLYARKCEVRVVDVATKQNFFDQYHIQGRGDGSISYGLYNNTILVSAISFINKGNGLYDLNRYATSTHVVGGFSKLLAHFRKNNDWLKIISYADRRWSIGTMYLTNGFTLVNVSACDYFYTKNTMRFHRRNFTKQNIKKLFKNYDDNLSEYENCLNNNFLRIWGCGQMRFELINPSK